MILGDLCCCLRTAGVAREDGTSLLGLDGAEALQFLGAHFNPVAEADFAGGAAEETDTVRVEGFVDGGGAGLGAGHRDAR